MNMKSSFICFNRVTKWHKGVSILNVCVRLSIYNTYVCVCLYLSVCVCVSLCLCVYPRLLCGLSSSIVLIEAKGSALSPQRFRSPYIYRSCASRAVGSAVDCAAGQSATGRQKYVNAEGACVSGLSSVLTDLTITTGNNNNKNNNNMSSENYNNINFGGTGNGSREVAQAQSRAEH